MIAHITGTILALNDRFIIVQTNGIGYRIFAPAETLVKHTINETISLWINHIVREDTEELFGFETIRDQNLFELLLGVSGIGPKSALGIMNVATIGTIARAIHTNDVSYLTKISGIGKKTAEKIILELRDKIHAIHIEHVDETMHDVIDALIALGYAESKVRDVVRLLDTGNDMNTNIREALKKLGTS